MSQSIFAAITSGDVAGVQSILEANPSSVKIRDERGFSPLVLATYLGNLDIIKLILVHEEDIDAAGPGGNTALMGVSFKGHHEIVSMLIANGADVNAVNDTNSTALAFAAMFGKTEIARLLIDKGADKSIKDSQGMTAYDHAKLKDFAETMALLK